MKVWSICALISVTITGIWTKFGTEHKYHTTNTMEWPNSHKLKFHDGSGRHLEFPKNVNNFGLDKDILHQIIWENAPRRRGDAHVTKSRNRKLIRVTSSNEGLKHMCVDLRTITYIWTKFCTEHKYHTTNTPKWPNSSDIWTKFGTEHKYCTINTPEWSNLHKLKIQDGGGRHLAFRKKCK